MVDDQVCPHQPRQTAHFSAEERQVGVATSRLEPGFGDVHLELAIGASELTVGLSQLPGRLGQLGLSARKLVPERLDLC
jgi:hypothetical protein